MRITQKCLLLTSVLAIGFNSIVSAQNDYLTTYSLSVGEILDSPNQRMFLPDGGRVIVSRVKIGSADNDVFHSGFGAYNTNQFGGTLNGNDNVNDFTGSINDNAITLNAYEGNKRAKFFSRIVSDPSLVDNGENTQYANAIGYHIRTTKPQIYNQFLMLDLDGSGAANNQEWISSFGYNDNGTNFVNRIPTYTLSGSTYLTEYSGQPVNATWQAMVRSKTDNTVNVASKNIIRKTSGGIDIDPDDRNAQVLIDYGNARTTDIFFLWGIWGGGNTSSASGQNSGLSPLVFKYNFDFGDAPGTKFNTRLEDSGARHLFTNTGGIYLGSFVNREADGFITNDDANNDIDDDGKAEADTSTAWRVFMTDGVLSRLVDTFNYRVNFTNSTGLTGHIAAWIDWNGNGRFSADEGIAGTTSSTSGTYTFTWYNKTLTRTSSNIDKTFIRIRYTTDNMNTTDYHGVKSDGEVEDYAIPLFIKKALPVNLVAFDVTKNEKNISYKWKVTNQKNIDEYVILKSLDGKQFTTFYTLKANAAESYNYQYTSSQEKTEATYYKLAVHDKNGEINYSSVKFVDFSGRNMIAVYPNPAKDKLNIDLNTATAKTGFIYNTNGQIVQIVALTTGTNIINISSLKNGTYFIDLNIGDRKGSVAGYTKFEVINN